VPGHLGSLRHTDVTANRYRITVDPRPRSKLEVGAEDHDIAVNLFVNPEVRENRSPARRGVCHTGEHQQQQQEEGREEG
jgi:hypothetical protein